MNKRFGQNVCNVCRLPGELCYCDGFIPIHTHTSFTFLVHINETFKPSNTSLASSRFLENSSVILRGAGDSSSGASDQEKLKVCDTTKTLFLFPEIDAIPIHEVDVSEGPFHIVVPDGTWRQAKRTRRRFPQLEGVQAISIPAKVKGKRKSIYDLRKSKVEDGMCTMEAVIEVLRHLESEEVAKSMEELLYILVKQNQLHRFGKTAL